MTTEMTKDEAYAVAEFIDANVFDCIRSDLDYTEVLVGGRIYAGTPYNLTEA